MVIQSRMTISTLLIRVILSSLLVVQIIPLRFAELADPNQRLYFEIVSLDVLSP